MSTAPNRTKLSSCLNALELISKLGVIHKRRLKRKVDGYPKVHSKELLFRGIMKYLSKLRPARFISQSQ